MTRSNKRNFSPEFKLEAAQLVLDYEDVYLYRHQSTTAIQPDHFRFQRW
ncbi:transposase insN for insertion sequence element IS911 [Yersinia aldovae]|uniref:Transposase insN for insertion sequence element IS911 n=1 Tax=Yersinia aldovae TaxID=29483 RepID=A0A0T9UQN7_YERAL|nr:transposase insN for insertion sequence element IS911 [Yersinia aldovae]CNL59135.1 transposase insN for insertion sequence element IS911 [Yersinia aldovae]